MAQKVVSRSQKRMERKQAVILVLLVLVVSLASFSLGVMVGRGGSQEQASVPRSSEPLTLPTATPATASSQTTKAIKEQPGPVAAPDQRDSAAVGSTTEGATEEATDKLTFYDTLPRGQQPLGSGINLPPRVESAAVPEPEVGKTAAGPAAKQVERVASLPSKTVSAIPAPPTSVAPGAGYVVQIASFKKATQAAELRGRLAVKGYVTFVKSADLGSKGVWHRVFAGPYSERSLADKAAGKLHREEKFSPLVRKR